MSDSSAGSLPPSFPPTTRTVPLPAGGYYPPSTRTTPLAGGAGGGGDFGRFQLPPEWRGYFRDPQLLFSGDETILWRSDFIGATAPPVPCLLRRSFYSSGQEYQINLDELAHLNHPNIVRSLIPPVLAQGNLWQALEFCPAGSVEAEQLRRTAPGNTLQALPLAEIESVVRGVAEALRYLHAEVNLIHTDIKPDNILLRDDGSVALIDFDRSVRADFPPHLGNMQLRTPEYHPQDLRLTPAWDWFQLGLVVVHLATGSRAPATDYPSLDFDRLEQSLPRLGLLIRGLLTPWRSGEGSDRWGYAEVQQWLQGGNPVLRGEDIAAASHSGPRRFAMEFRGHVYDSPQDLADTLGDHWSAARRAIQEPVADRPYLAEVADRLRAAGLPAADRVQALSQLVARHHPDVIVAQLIAALDPESPPKYSPDDGSAYFVDRLGLKQLALEVLEAVDRQETGQRAVVTISQLFNLGILTAFEVQGLRQIDTNWHQGVVAYLRLAQDAARGVAAARAKYQSQLREAQQGERVGFSKLQADVWETDAGAASPRVLAQVLAAMVDAKYQDNLCQRATVWRDTPPEGQEWFAKLAGSRPVRTQLLMDLIARRNHVVELY